MDVPKRQVSWLESFSPDILAYFVWYLPGEQVVRLTMTGATLLRQRLKSSNAVKSIKLGTDYFSYKSFPRFLHDFPSLDELSLYACDDNCSRVFGLRIDLIPSGVKKLKLSGTWFQSPQKLFGEDGTLKLSQHLPHLEVLDLSDVRLESNTWMNHCPPSLTSLSLREWHGTEELPFSLIHVQIGSCFISKDSFVAKFPPSLESFFTSYVIGGDLLVPLLPASTVQLSLGRLIQYSSARKAPEPPPRNLLEQIPKSLTWLSVPQASDTNFEKSPESATLLPATLTMLVVQSAFPPSAWHLLPRGLTTLSLTVPRIPQLAVSTITDHQGIERKVTYFPFDLLPRSITDLDLVFSGSEQHFCGLPETSDRPFFPPNLTSLKAASIQFSPQTAKLLPSSLTYLALGNFCEQVCEHLPSGLKTLTAFQTRMSPNLINFLPRSLTFLRLSLYPVYGAWFDYDTGQKIDSVTTLPAHAIHKNCLLPDFDWKGYSLPSTLTYLAFRDQGQIGDSFMRHQHLPNLLELDLSSSKTFTDLSIPHLSPHLTILKLPLSGGVTGKSFKFLPRNLTHLDLNGSESISDSEIQHLPRTLKKLLASRAIHLTDLCIPDLPPHLEELHMRFNEKITSSSLPHFPYPLRSSQAISFAEFNSWDLTQGAVGPSKWRDLLQDPR